MWTFSTRSIDQLEELGFPGIRTAYCNLSVAQLVEQAIARDEGQLTATGALAVQTGKHTGRSPQDKFYVAHGSENSLIDWGATNFPISEKNFDQIHKKVTSYLKGRDVFIQDLSAGADPDYTMNIRITTQKAWAGLLAHNLFREYPIHQFYDRKPDFNVIHVPDLIVDSRQEGLHSGTFVLVDMSRSLALIGGTAYGGEIKKTIFSILNYHLPLRGVLTMHCAANIGPQGDTALFFGLSGTGKTTLSSDPERFLIGDDEHGWSSNGIFNFEGGCYAKVYNLDQAYEPIIWHAVQQFGTVLENVVIDPQSRIPDFENASFTENIRAAYPLSHIPEHVQNGLGGHPRNIFFLSADAFGVLPPVARLSKEQAMYYFLSGYTSKLGGTETGLSKEPQATFSTGFGAPFFPLNPIKYAQLLGEKIEKHQVNVWLINTGWYGGPYGIGKRYPLPYTRALLKAALNNQLDKVAYFQEPSFGLWLPEDCPGVPYDLLDPQKQWESSQAYHKNAQHLIEQFTRNFKQFAEQVAPAVRNAAPGV